MYADEIYTAGFCYGLDVSVGESYNGVGEYVYKTHNSVFYNIL